MVTRGTSKKSKKDPDYGKIRIFVYGTLKRGRANNAVLKQSGAEFLGYDKITVDGSFVDMGHFPAVIMHNEDSDSNPDKTTIFGEVWYGTQDIIKSCDVLEGYPLFFDRQKMWSDIMRKRVWVYTLHEDWFAEVNTFLEPPIWQADKSETVFWNEYAKDTLSKDRLINRLPEEA